MNDPNVLPPEAVPLKPYRTQLLIKHYFIKARSGSHALQNNRQRMRYDDYLVKGYPLASGVIEGACRYVVKDRMERAGMRWTAQGAQAMLDLRTTYVNGQWDDYQAWRIDQETRRLYPHQNLLETIPWSLVA